MLGWPVAWPEATEVVGRQRWARGWRAAAGQSPGHRLRLAGSASSQTPSPQRGAAAGCPGGEPGVGLGVGEGAGPLQAEPRMPAAIKTAGTGCQSSCRHIRTPPGLVGAEGSSHVNASTLGSHVAHGSERVQPTAGGNAAHSSTVPNECQVASVCKAVVAPVTNPETQAILPRVELPSLPFCHRIQRSFNPLPSRICCMCFSTLDSRVLDCLGAEK